MSKGHPGSVLVVGAGAAGIAVAEGLRRNGYPGLITIVGDEVEAPYDRPPLSKRFLAGEWRAEQLQLLSDKRHHGLAVDWRLGRRAVSVDRGVALLDDGSDVAHDELVIATGVRPRTLPCCELEGVHVLRTQRDAIDLRRDLAPGRRLVIVGGGFLGLEVAATARKLGAEVTVVEPEDEPLASKLGYLPASRLVALHRAKGVDVRAGTTVTRFVGTSDLAAAPGRLDHVELSDGTVVGADAVLVAIGSMPCVDWLAGSPVRVGDGVICDEFCRAAPGIWAAGDVAHWPHRWLRRGVRFEHRMNASEQGRAVAENILGANRPFVPAPYFWTDQYHVRIQACGSVAQAGDVEWREVECGEDSFVLEHRRHDDGTLVGALIWSAAKHVVAYRREIQAAITASANDVRS